MNALAKNRPPTRQDFQRAIESMDTYIDVTVDDLMELSRRAEQQAFRRRREILNVESVMSHPLAVVRPHATLSEAAHLMVSRRISGLPVVDEAEVLCGILTEADFLRALGLPAHPPSHNLWQTLESLFRELAHHGELEAPDDPVSRHMQSDVVTIRKERQIVDVVELMKQHHVKRIVVCDGQKHPLGMVTRSDLIKVFFDTFIHKA